jgi:hypothetical protein
VLALYILARLIIDIVLVKNESINSNIKVDLLEVIAYLEDELHLAWLDLLHLGLLQDLVHA